MRNSKEVVILHNEVGAESKPDELDVLVQVNSVTESLVNLGFKVTPISVSLDLKSVAEDLRKIGPVFVFNLVESIAASGRLIHFIPALLEELRIPFTGSDPISMLNTGNKILCKKILRDHMMPTPDWSRLDDGSVITERLPIPGIVKHIWEDASIGLDFESVIFNGGDLDRKLNYLGINRKDYFIEGFIPGREFNISVIGTPEGASVLPPAEILFVDFPPDKPAIVDYKAKWETGSFEYEHTRRTFDFRESDSNLLAELKFLSQKCWDSFALRDYARVDFRVSEKGDPFILEINANPCISPDSGFTAACDAAGISYDEMIKRIISQAVSVED